MIELLGIAIVAIFIVIYGILIYLMERSIVRKSISQYVDDDIRLLKVEIENIKHFQKTRKVFIDVKIDAIESLLGKLSLRLEKIELWKKGED